MKFNVDKVSKNYSYEKPVEINTIEELMDFVKENGDIIIWGEKSGFDNPYITIYDDYIE